MSCYLYCSLFVTDCDGDGQLIFLEPGIDYVLNATAAQQLHDDPRLFKKGVQEILCGGKHYGMDFPPHPRQLEKQRHSWGLRVKRGRDPEPSADDADMEDDGINGGGTPSSVEFNTFAPAWKRKRVE